MGPVGFLDVLDSATRPDSADLVDFASRLGDSADLVDFADRLDSADFVDSTDIAADFVDSTDIAADQDTFEDNFKGAEAFEVAPRILPAFEAVPTFGAGVSCCCAACCCAAWAFTGAGGQPVLELAFIADEEAVETSTRFQRLFVITRRRTSSKSRGSHAYRCGVRLSMDT